MATDPVSAFLTGFRAVDEYETNKQRRAMMDEQMSWNRKLWGEQEKQWARDELDRYRTEKYAQFEARVQDVINSVPREEANSWFSDENMKDGEITGFSKVTNQVLKEMIAEDPEFGEHIAQAYGQDPRAGALVNNKLHPVHSVGIHPLQGVWFQVNSVNGPQPLTKFRTSQGNDPVYFGKTGLKELVKIFGPNASNSQMAITRQLHGALGIERDGSPVDTPRTQGQPSGGAAGASAGGSKTGTGHLERQREFQENQLEEIDTASLPAPRFTQEETNAMGPSEAEGGLPPLEGDVQRSESGGAVRGRIPGPGETIGGAFNKNDRSQLDEYLGPEAGGQLIDTITGRSDEEAPIEAEASKPFGAATVESLSATVKYMANWYKQIPGTGAKIARDSKEKGVETAYNVAKEINSWFDSLDNLPYMPDISKPPVPRCSIKQLLLTSL